jgi:hypothetical protein
MEIFEISLNNEKNYSGHTLSIEKMTQPLPVDCCVLHNSALVCCVVFPWTNEYCVMFPN